MTDRIEYVPPFGPAGALGEPLMIRPRLERMLAYRHELLSRDLETHARFGDRPPLRVAVSGASGLIGRALVPFLTTGGHTVVRLVRGRAREGEAAWNYEHGRIEAGKLEGLDAVVHLAGENIAARWTAARRRRILDSRAIGTRFLAETLARLRRPPRILVSASAIGIYGNRGQEALTEASPYPRGARGFPHRGQPRVGGGDGARARGRNPRGPAAVRGGPHARGRRARPHAAAVPARGRRAAGGGTQWMSWIGIDDLLGAVHHALITEALAGPVNVTAPNPVTSRTFASTLGRVLHRPAVLRVPRAALHLAFGEMADVALLSSARVLPARLQESGYGFRYPGLEGALRFLLGRSTPT
jgi:Predicted nucleoside-diphosphate sugar epimerase